MACCSWVLVTQTTSDFIQEGKFYLWLETDTPSNLYAHPHHPGQLTREKMAEFLSTEFGLESAYYQPLKKELIDIPRHFPTLNGQPLPSPELDFEGVFLSEDATLSPWHIHCYALPSPMKNLNHIHFLVKHQPNGVKLGSDFLFWHHVSHSLKTVLQKDQYIPGLLKHSESQTLYKNWQIISASYQYFLQHQPDKWLQVSLSRELGNIFSWCSIKETFRTRSVMKSKLMAHG